MLVSKIWVILAWIMAVLLLVNSLVILVNIFDFPATVARHLISLVSALGVVAGLMFIVLGISQRLGFSRRG
jgi:hypothetical protein